MLRYLSNNPIFGCFLCTLLLCATFPLGAFGASLRRDDPVIISTLHAPTMLTSPVSAAPVFYSQIFGFDPQTFDTSHYGLQLKVYEGFLKVSAMDMGPEGDGTVLGAAVYKEAQSFALTSLNQTLIDTFTANNRTDLTMTISIVAGEVFGVKDSAFYGVRSDFTQQGQAPVSMIFPLGLSDSLAEATTSASEMAAGQNAPLSNAGEYDSYGGTQQACIDYWAARFDTCSNDCIVNVALCEAAAITILATALAGCLTTTIAAPICIGLATLAFLVATATCANTCRQCINGCGDAFLDHLVNDCHATIYRL